VKYTFVPRLGSRTARECWCRRRSSRNAIVVNSILYRRSACAHRYSDHQRAPLTLAER
jgi:hypothetical protein